MAGRSWWARFLLFAICCSVAMAASPVSFCKCTCFSNSTIIPLDDAVTTQKPGLDQDKTAVRGRSCNECNKQFCLGYHLPICQGATEDDVFTTCFQRDSRKDATVVFVFILATGGLLLWAAVKPWVDAWRAGSTSRPQYAPVRNGETEEQ